MSASVQDQDNLNAPGEDDIGVLASEDGAYNLSLVTENAQNSDSTLLQASPDLLYAIRYH